jgi:hypothetical protein
MTKGVRGVSAARFEWDSRAWRHLDDGPSINHADRFEESQGDPRRGRPMISRMLGILALAFATSPAT